MPDHRLAVSLRQDGPIPLDVEFGCDPGHVLAIFGPSVSGKTTILRAIAGFARPAHGRVQSGADTLLSLDPGGGAGDSILLRNVTVASLTAADFVF